MNEFNWLDISLIAKITLAAIFYSLIMFVVCFIAVLLFNSFNPKVALDNVN